MSSILCYVDEKHVPLYRVIWVSELPHFCGHEDCDQEGRYEITARARRSRLGESRGARRDDRGARTLERRPRHGSGWDVLVPTSLVRRAGDASPLISPLIPPRRMLTIVHLVP